MSASSTLRLLTHRRYGFNGIAFTRPDKQYGCRELVEGSGDNRSFPYLEDGAERIIFARDIPPTVRHYPRAMSVEPLPKTAPHLGRIGKYRIPRSVSRKVSLIVWQQALEWPLG